MNLKKTIITVLALFAIAAALYGVYQWQKNTAFEPQRQEHEIR